MRTSDKLYSPSQGTMLNFPDHTQKEASSYGHPSAIDVLQPAVLSSCDEGLPELFIKSLEEGRKGM